MQTRAWGNTIFLTFLGVATGWALHCQGPPSHTRVGASEDCATCHLDDYQRASQPLHVGIIPMTCAECHGNASWSPARGSAHSWPLEGAHATAACSACHLGEPPLYAGTPTACLGCHQSDREAALVPSHDDFSSDCATCHGTTAWRPAGFVHEWPLDGAHASATCGACHVGDPPVYDGTPDTCVGCHQGARDAVAQPSHAAFADDCTSCHTTLGWRPAVFPLHEWPLEGAHAATTCAACHGEPAVYAGTSPECVGCHQADYDGSPFPGHSEFATTCEDCHSTSGWVPASGGDHPQERFSITGTHDFACGDCHDAALGANGAANADCVGCHLGEHSLARMDSEHRGEVDDYPFGENRAPNFCLQCHPDGRE